MFIWFERIDRAKRFADLLASINWLQVLNGYERRVNPLMGTLLGKMQYYWVTSQCEYAADVMVRSVADLAAIYPKLVSHIMQ